MKIAAINAGIRPHTGTLFSHGIRWEQRPRGRIGKLFIRLYGVQLDSMDTHWVSVKKSRSRLLSWARQARRSSIRRRARLVDEGKINSFGIFVRPKPFIRRGYMVARPKLTAIMKRELQGQLNRR